MAATLKEIMQIMQVVIEARARTIRETSLKMSSTRLYL
jgi:hypothetical protein